MPQPSELDYHYGGPKPQTREAALIMLADAIERIHLEKTVSALFV